MNGYNDYGCILAFQYRKRYVRVATVIFRLFVVYSCDYEFQYRKRYVRVATEEKEITPEELYVSIPQAVCTRCNTPLVESSG